MDPKMESINSYVTALDSIVEEYYSTQGDNEARASKNEKKGYMSAEMHIYTHICAYICTYARI